MRLLLDTHVAIWAVSAPERIPAKYQALIADADACFVSLASYWEVALKFATSRASTIPLSVEQAAFEFSRAEFQTLDITLTHIGAIETLRLGHGDPFDRLILAQAISEPLRLVTKDRELARYSDAIISW